MERAKIRADVFEKQYQHLPRRISNALLRRLFSRPQASGCPGQCPLSPTFWSAALPMSCLRRNCTAPTAQGRLLRYFPYRSRLRMGRGGAGVQVPPPLVSHPMLRLGAFVLWCLQGSQRHGIAGGAHRATAPLQDHVGDGRWAPYYLPFLLGGGRLLTSWRRGKRAVASSSCRHSLSVLLWRVSAISSKRERRAILGGERRGGADSAIDERLGS